MNICDVKRLINEYIPYDNTEAGMCEAVKTFLSIETSETAFSRTNITGHITASGFVFNVNKDRVILLHHNILMRWLQPGGHIDPTDKTIIEAILREIKEETGLNGIILLDGKIFDIDVHSIPANPKKQEPFHFHYDLRFLLTVEDDNFTANSESTAIFWSPVSTLIDSNTASLKRAGRKLFSFQRKGGIQN